MACGDPPSSEPLAVIQRQLEIYNKRDVDEFMTLFAEDCALLDLQTGTELARGKDSIRERYTKRFASPGLKCILHARMAIGRVVVDKELITGLPDGKEANCMAVYQVNEQGLICRVRSASFFSCRMCLRKYRVSNTHSHAAQQVQFVWEDVVR